jgi:phosphate transport system protein
VLSEPVLENKGSKTENKIDKLDVKIDDICQSVFALQQPVASDLRFIISCKLVGDRKSW